VAFPSDAVPTESLCAVYLDADSPYKDLGTQLAQTLGLPTCTDDCREFAYHLRYLPAPDDGPPRLTLIHVETNTAGKKPQREETTLCMDFVGGSLAHRRQFGGGKGQPLARAVGLKGNAALDLVDATAGLGRDAFVLASLGARVTLLERSPVIAALLQDGLERARQDPEVGSVVEDRLHLITTDAIHWLRHCAGQGDIERPAVVYLDPMYPHRTKSALVKKEMRFLRDFAGDNPDAPELLATALGCARQRVVVKRPTTAQPVAGPTPVGAVKSKNTRYDIYAPSGNTP
jgi:16S rRNA (guanine1516-N2)-methyltransferase